MWKESSFAAIGVLIVMQCVLAPLGTALAKPADLLWEGDTVISGNETYSDCLISLRGSLIITGSLTLSGVELVVEPSFNGEYKIVVEQGGSFNVLSSCNIHSSDPSVHYLFQVMPDGTLRMDESELHDCGWDDCENWTVNPYPERGLYIDSDNVSITDCIISDNNVGVLVDNGSAPSICNNTISGNSVSGIEVYSGSSPLVDGNTIMQNVAGSEYMIYFFAAGIATESSSPVITNNTITLNKDVSGIFISGGSGTLVANNMISAHVDSNGYGNYWGIFSFADSVSIVDNLIFGNDNGIMFYGGENTVEGNEMIDNDNPSGGVGILDASMSEFSNNSVSGSTIGVFLADGSSSSFANMTITNSSDGVNGYSDTTPYNCFFYNCSFSENRRDVALDPPIAGYYGGGTVTLVNPRYDPAKVRVLDENGILYVKWFVKVRVVYESSSAGVAGADVKFKDARGAITGPQKTGADGWSGMFTLSEYKYSGNTKITLSPQELTAVLGNRINTTQVEVASSLETIISLHDLPPHLEVLSPSNGSITNQSNIVLKGKTEPGAFVEIDGTRIEAGVAGDWKADLQLGREGANEIEVTAYDGMLNQASLTIMIFRDTVTPVIKVNAPAENLLLNRSSVLISGTVSEPAGTLTINGAPVTIGPDGSFSVTLPLDEGRNTFELVCRDAAGNVVSAVRHVVLDTIPPMLKVDAPATGAATNGTTVTATGGIEPGSELTINGKYYTIAGAAFSAVLELAEGDNLFVFCARDRAGNQNATQVRVLRDSTPPALKPSSPVDGARINSTLAVVAGTTEENATVKVNGKPCENLRGQFIAAVTLHEGTNTITVEAWDALLNLASGTVTVFVDTLAPALSITDPANNTLTNQTSVVIIGHTEPGATVLVAGRNASVNAQGKFSLEVPLESEGQNVIDITARDGLFNTASFRMVVRRDTVVGYNLTAPGDGQKVKTKNLTVSGKAEPGATVVIAGVRVPLGADGSFCLVVPLDYGANRITVVINDTAGNSESLSIGVTRVRPSGGASGQVPLVPVLAGALAFIAMAAAAGLFLRRRKAQ